MIPFVVLSDCLLAAVAGVLAALMTCRGGKFGIGFALFFGAAGAAAALGAAAHQFFPQPGTPGHLWLWAGILAAMGMAGAAAAWIGGNIFFSTERAAWGVSAIAAGLALAGAAVLTTTHSFFATALFFLPPILFLLAAFLFVFRRTGAKSLWPGIAGLALIAAASFATLTHHNSLYHLIQAAALIFIFITASLLAI